MQEPIKFYSTTKHGDTNFTDTSAENEASQNLFLPGELIITRHEDRHHKATGRQETGNKYELTRFVGGPYTEKTSERIIGG